MTKKEAKALLKQNSGQFYVYELLRPTGEPFYVGKGKSGSKPERLFSHGYRKGGNPLKVNIIEKIKATGGNLRYGVCEFFDEERDAFVLEIELIAKYGRRDNGTGILANMSDGGEGGSGAIRTSEMRVANSLRKKKYYESHPDRVMLLDEWCKANPAKALERQRKSDITNRSKAHREATSKRRILFYKNHPEMRDHMSTKIKEWIKNNPEKEAARQAKVKATLGSDEARKKNSDRVKKWHKDNPEKLMEINQKKVAWFKNNPKKAAERQVKIMVVRKTKTTIRLRCLDFIEKHSIDIEVPDGRTAISIWMGFENELYELAI